MAKQTRKSTTRLSCPPPGTMVFAEGGKVETADELMARIAGKYGVTGQAQAAPVQQPVPQPQPKAQPLPQQQGLTGGIVGLLKGRAAQIDRAVNGYAEGGKIKGPGTAKSDSIPATVRETGEGIKVSNGERIVSKEHDAYLESVAKNAGYESLNAMLEDGTGKPVGPTVKAGKRAAADGMTPELDPFAYRGGPAAGITVTPRADDIVKNAITAPPTLGGAPLARSEPAGALSNPIISGLTAEPFNRKSETPRMAFDIDPQIAGRQAQPAAKDSRDAAYLPEINGITWNSKGFDPRKEDMAPGTGVIAITSGPNAGKNIAVGPQTYTAPDGTPTSTHRGSQENLQGIADADGIKKQLANIQRMRLETDAFDPSITDPNVRASARAALANADQRIERQGLTEGRQLENQLKAQRLTSAGRLDALQAEYVAEQDPDKREQLAEQIRGLKGYRSTDAGGLTLPMQRSNAEIDAARARIAGLTPDEIKQKTQQFSATGRENSAFDQTLAKAVTLANRRKVGADDEFDSRQQVQPPAGTDGDMMTRFRGDKAMQGHKTGQMTDQGLEVFDASGHLIGHYR